MNNIFFKVIADVDRQIEMLSIKNKKNKDNLAMQIYWQTYVTLAVKEGCDDSDITFALARLVQTGIKTGVDIVFSSGSGEPKIYSTGKS